jgi:hypothetical protein
MISQKSITAFVFIAAIVFVLFMLVSQHNDCLNRETVTPEIPLYMDSTYISEEVPFDSSGGKIVSRQYEVLTSPQNVREFYERYSLCSENVLENEVRCDGKAQPFGSFTVRIDFVNSNTTNYVVEIRWDKCGQREGVSLDNP